MISRPTRRRRAILAIGSAGSRTTVFCNVGNVRLSVGGFERLTSTLLAGQDRVQIGDLSGTGMSVLQIVEGPEADSDGVDVTGTSGDDRIRVSGPTAAGITISGLAATVQVSGAEQLGLRGLNGNDVIDAGRLIGGRVSISEAGNGGNDILVGTPGNDLLFGGDDDDRLEGRGGVDILDGGRGDNVIIP